MERFIKQLVVSGRDALRGKSHYQRIAESLQLLTEISQKPGLGSKSRILIENGKAIIALDDGTRFYVNPTRTSLSVDLLVQPQEPIESGFFKSFIRPGWRVVDAGANFGWHSVHLSRLVGDKGRVHSFEPIPATNKELQDNISLNKCENATAYKFALGALDEWASFGIPQANQGSGIAGRKSYGLPQRVEVRALDSLKLGKVDFIKVDVEGGELDLLQGAIKTLGEFRPSLMVECDAHLAAKFGHSPQQLAEFFKELDYSIYGFDAGRLKELAGFTNPSAEVNNNFVLIPRESAGSLGGSKPR